MTICDRTGLTKPECHCPTCMAAMIAEHAPALRAPVQPVAPRGATEISRYAADREAA
jgi:hypothetical protein